MRFCKHLSDKSEFVGISGEMSTQLANVPQCRP